MVFGVRLSLGSGVGQGEEPGHPSVVEAIVVGRKVVGIRRPQARTWIAASVGPVHSIHPHAAHSTNIAVVRVALKCTVIKGHVTLYP